MKITVKISDIEIVVDRPAFAEETYWERMGKQFNEQIKETVIVACDKAKELYKLKFENNED